jgi:flagellar biosynthesis regulator FlaF
MYEFAYSGINEDLPAGAPPPDRLRLADAIELFCAASLPAAAPHLRQQLLSEFRRLWLAIANDLARDCAGYPAEMLAEMRSASSELLAEIERRRFERTGSGAETGLPLP